MAASSRVLQTDTRFHFEAVDPGHLLFGLDAGMDERIVIPRKAALLALETQVVQVQTDNSGSASKIAMLPLGFADTADRSNAGFVLIDGEPAPVLTPISAEHMRVDGRRVKNLAVGMRTVLIGRDGDRKISLDDVSRHQGGRRHIEIAMCLPVRMHREYQ